MTWHNPIWHLTTPWWPSWVEYLGRLWGCHLCKCNLHLVRHRLWNAESPPASILRCRENLSCRAVAGLFLRLRTVIEAYRPQVLLLLERGNGLELVPRKQKVYTWFELACFCCNVFFFLMFNWTEMNLNRRYPKILFGSRYYSVFAFLNILFAFSRFDFVLVLFSIIENILSFVLLSTSEESGESGRSGVNLGFLRLLRLCKIVKILRVFRTLRFFSELRLMLDCVVGSLMNVFWCLIMLLFVMYVFALLLQQGVVQHLQEAKPSSDQGAGCAEGGLQTYFSSVGVTVVTLFQSCTSGVDWNEPYKALQETGSFLPVSFLLYIAFVFISVWNIVTLIWDIFFPFFAILPNTFFCQSMLL